MRRAQESDVGNASTRSNAFRGGRVARGNGLGHMAGAAAVMVSTTARAPVVVLSLEWRGAGVARGEGRGVESASPRSGERGLVSFGEVAYRAEEWLWCGGEVGPFAALLPGDEPGLNQDSHVVRNGWLREADWRCEVADAHLAGR